MDIACMTENGYLSSQVEQQLAALSQRFTAYRSVAALARSLDQQQHDVVLLAGEDDLVDTFLSCRLQAGDGHGPLVILLSETDHGINLDRALDAGVDDYVCIGSGLAQLEPRIRACARRRSSKVQHDVVTLQDVSLDRRDGSARARGSSVDLTQREFLLAWVLFCNVGRVVSPNTLAEAVWGTSADVAKRTIEQHVYRLRCKLGLGGRDGLHLSTVYGRGYRLDEGSATDPGPLALLGQPPASARLASASGIEC
jgi:DNA-binding response OmpR family regulator